MQSSLQNVAVYARKLAFQGYSLLFEPKISHNCQSSTKAVI